MKKFLMIAVAAMAVASQAATISWQLSSTTDTGYAANQTVLLFVGAADEKFGDNNDLSLSDYVDSLLSQDTTAAAEAAAFDKATTSVGRGGTISTAAKTKDVSYAAGSDIVGMIVVLDGNGKYSGFSFATQVAGAGETQLVTSSADSNTGGFVDLPSGSGQQIPEPATGALALAGLALLFKRRRA